MLGYYEGFPENPQKTAFFTFSISNKRLQQTLIQTLYEINGKSFDLQEVSDPSIPNCTVIFEFGIAEENTFNYLDKEENKKLLKVLKKTPFKITDFYCAVRYYKTKNDKKTPLKFDYYMVRFLFENKLLETRIFHERGPEHATPDDIINFIIGRINEKLSRKIVRILEES
ncbi:hypothetical protein CW667_05980 [Candidatus Bathyarchaeota archaeon]|nr:MAG: hypothetical protein CW667_05980 [Candidatus Bathyarchaeota archaeon]